MAKLSKAQFVINDSGRGGSGKGRIVTGYLSACGRFGVHKWSARKDAGYQLDHVPTGYGLGLQFRTLAEAAIAIDKFLALPLDWASTDPSFLGKSTAARELYRAMRRQPLHREVYKGIPLGEDYANPYVDVPQVSA